MSAHLKRGYVITGNVKRSMKSRSRINNLCLLASPLANFVDFSLSLPERLAARIWIRRCFVAKLWRSAPGKIKVNKQVPRTAVVSCSQFSNTASLKHFKPKSRWMNLHHLAYWMIRLWRGGDENARVENAAPECRGADLCPSPYTRPYVYALLPRNARSTSAVVLS